MSSLYVRGGKIWICFYRQKICFRKSLKLSDDGPSWRMAKAFQKKLDGELALEYFNRMLDAERPMMLSECYKKFTGSRGEDAYKIPYDYLFAVTGDIPANLVSQEHFTRLKSELLSKNKKQNTLVSYFNQLRIIFNYFLKQKYVSTNPVPRIRPEQRPVVTVPGHEIDLIFNHLNSTDPAMANLVRLLSLTGFRLSEALRLTKEDVNYSENLITVHNTKAKRNEQFPLYPELRQFLSENLGNIYSGDRGHALKTFQRACASLNLKKYKLHDLRRSFASRYVSKFTATELKTIMRHKSINTTIKHYISHDISKLAERF